MWCLDKVCGVLYNGYSNMRLLQNNYRLTLTLFLKLPSSPPLFPGYWYAIGGL
jgi:hypothetical protein